RGEAPRRAAGRALRRARRPAPGCRRPGAGLRHRRLPGEGRAHRRHPPRPGSFRGPPRPGASTDGASVERPPRSRQRRGHALSRLPLRRGLRKLGPAPPRPRGRPARGAPGLEAGRPHGVRRAEPPEPAGDRDVQGQGGQGALRGVGGRDGLHALPCAADPRGDRLRRRVHLSLRLPASPDPRELAGRSRGVRPGSRENSPDTRDRGFPAAARPARLSLPAPVRRDVLFGLLVLAVLAALFPGLVFGGQVLFERDLHQMLYGQYASFARTIHAGSLPVWDPWPGFGQPMLANPAAQVLYPPTWLSLILSPETTYTVYVVLHLAIGALGLRALASRLGASPS